MASQITSLTIVYSTVYSKRRSKKHQSSVSLAFVRGIHRWQMNSLHKGPVTRIMFSFDDVIVDTNLPANVPIISNRIVADSMNLAYFCPYLLTLNAHMLGISGDNINIYRRKNTSIHFNSFPLIPHASVNWIIHARRHPITWTNVDILSIKPLRTNFCEIRIKILICQSWKCLRKCRLWNSGQFVQM